jgi:hypothetical protein
MGFKGKIHTKETKRKMSKAKNELQLSVTDISAIIDALMRSLSILGYFTYTKAYRKEIAEKLTKYLDNIKIKIKE